MSVCLPGVDVIVARVILYTYSTVYILRMYGAVCVVGIVQTLTSTNDESRNGVSSSRIGLENIRCIDFPSCSLARM